MTPSLATRHCRLLQLLVLGALAGVTACGDGAPSGPGNGPGRPRLAFMERRPDSGGVQLSVMNADGSGIRGLTPANERVTTYDWSPDGTRAAYVVAGQPGVRIVQANGTGRIVVGRDVARDEVVFVRWSADSRKLAFRSDATGQQGLYVVNRDGSGLHAATRFTGAEYFPTWSPDSRRLAVMRSDPASGSALWVVFADGSGERRLTSGTAAEHPDWSPDGREIAFDDNGAVWVVGADGQGLRRVTKSCFSGPGCGAPHQHPRWSPDGRRLVVQEYEPRNVLIVHADGSGDAARAPAIVGWDVASPTPVWSPDGSQLAFTSDVDGPPAIYTARSADLGNVTRVRGTGERPQWVP